MKVNNFEITLSSEIDFLHAVIVAVELRLVE